MPTALLLAMTLGGWSPEVSLGPLGNAVPVPSPEEPVATGLANDFLVAWPDTRFGGASVVMTSLVQRDGGVPATFGKFAAPFGSTHPSIASTATQAALVFEFEGDVYLRLMGQDGGFRGLPQKISSGRCPSVAVTDLGGLVVFESSEIRALRFAWDGTIVDSSSVQLSTGTQSWANCAKAAAAPDGTSFAVAWRENGNLNQVVVPFTGVPSTQTTLDMGTAAGRFEVAPLGGDHWWITSGWVTGMQASFRRYDVTLTTGLAAADVLPLDTWIDLDISPCAAGVCLLARRDGPVTGELYSGVMSVDGGASVLVDAGIARSNEFDLTQAKSGDALLVVGNGGGLMRSLVTDSAFTPTATTGDLSLYPAAHQSTAVGVLSDAALLAWIQPEASGSAVYIRRFDLTGTPLDVAPVKIAGAKYQYNRIDVLPGNGGWLLGLTDEYGAGGSLLVVARDGQTSAEYELPFSDLYHLGFAVAGRDVLITAKHYEGSQWDPVLITVSPDGGVSKQVCQVTPVKEHYTGVAVNSLGERLVVWQDADSQEFVAGVRFKSDGTPMETSGFRISPPGQLALQPQIASDGATGFFVIWRDYQHLYVQHVEGSSASVPLQLTMGNALPVQERIITVSGGALITWADRRTGQVFAQTVTFDVSGVHTTGAEPIANLGFNAWPSAGIGPSSVWFAYSRANTTVNSMEGLALQFTREAPGNACQDGWNCVSGICGDAGLCEKTPEVIDAGTLLPDGGVAPRGPYRTIVAFACSTADAAGLIQLVLAALLLRKRRVH